MMNDLEDLLGDSVDILSETVDLNDLYDAAHHQDETKNDESTAVKKTRKYYLTGSCQVCGALANDQHRCSACGPYATSVIFSLLEIIVVFFPLFCLTQ